MQPIDIMSSMAQRTEKKPIRMTPVFFHILLAVADREKHGYAIMREVAGRSRSRVRLGPGSLYWSISRLQEAGLIEESHDRPAAEEDDERRRYYRLTDEGRRLLRNELQTLDEIVSYARDKRIFEAL